MSLPSRMSLPRRKILHAADIHLDSPLLKLETYENAPTMRIRHASRRALEKLTDLAIDQAVDLVVIAGDLYDGNWTDTNTGLFFVGQAAKLIDAGIPLLVIRGNHDAANQMTDSLPLPANPDGSDIFLSHEEPESRLFPELGTVVHGMSFRSRAESRNLSAKYPSPVSGLFNLGLLHTGLEGDSVHGNYAPCTAQQLNDKGYDYWALGHIHTQKDHRIQDGPPIVFPGNIQGRHIREQGEKGCVIIDVDAKNDCDYQFFPLDVLRWHEHSLDVSEMTHTDEICDAYQQWQTEMLQQLDGRLLISRVRLHGSSPLHHRLHQSYKSLVGDLQAISVAHGSGGVWLESVKISTQAPAESFVHADLEGPLESLQHELDSLRGSDELVEIIAGQLDELKRKLPKELDGEDAALPLDDPRWAGQLIESASAEVLARLQASHSPQSSRDLEASR